jgi:hypothetical protein
VTLNEEETCKYNKYNYKCDRPLFDESFCIFHSRDREGKKDKFMELFWKDFGNNEKKEFIGFVFPNMTSLNKADLEEADLTGANLTGVDLQEADLQGANLKGANLQKVKNITIEMLLSAKTLYKIKALDPELEKELKKTKPELFEKPS